MHKSDNEGLEAEIEYLRESLKTVTTRNKEYRDLLYISLQLMLAEDIQEHTSDDGITTLERYINKLYDLGIKLSQARVTHMQDA